VAGETPYRFYWSEEALERFFADYESERRAAGISSTLVHVSPRQRVDVVVTLSGLNRSAGWRREGEESAAALWLRYLTPVLAETRESAKALAAAIHLAGLPGSFDPEIHYEIVDDSQIRRQAPPSFGVKLRRFLRAVVSAGLHVLGQPLTLVVLAVSAGTVIAVAAGPSLAFYFGQRAYIPVEDPLVHVGKHAVSRRPVPPMPNVEPSDLPQRLRLRFVDITTAAAQQYGYSISPYTLAEYYAGESDFVPDPALFLSAMLKRWPLPAFEPLALDMRGAFALGQYSLAAAELELRSGLDPKALVHGIDLSIAPTEGKADRAFERLYERWGSFSSDGAQTVRSILARHASPRSASIDDNARLGADLGINAGDLLDIVLQIQQQLGTHLASVTAPRDRLRFVDRATVGDLISLVEENGLQPVVRGTMRPAAEHWPDWPRYLLFVPLLLALSWATFGLLGTFRAALLNPPQGTRGEVTRFSIRELARTEQPPARRLARRISHHRPEPTGRLDVERSITMTLRRGGYISTVPERRRRSAEYMFLISRRGGDDHAFEWARRLLDALARGGVEVHLYDYDPDPRTLFYRRLTGERSGPLDLRAARERHPKAGLVLVTDGNELVDYFTGRALPFVSELLRGWPQRMLLTPVPMAEWGEREMNLSAALDAPVGRLTAEGLDDLLAAFGERPRPALWRTAASAGENSLDSLVGRVRNWLVGCKVLLGVSRSSPPRPIEFRLPDPMLVSDIPPSVREQEHVISQLRGWLGDDGFYWLAACAVYPQLRYVVTVYLGQRLYGLGGQLYDERRLAQLVLLPWFGRGRMPDWLRRRLFSELTSSQQATVRTAVDSMLDAAWKLTEDTKQREQLKGVESKIWRPEQEGIEMAPDEVMAEMMVRKTFDLAPVLRLPAIQAMFGAELRRLVLSRAAVVAGVGLWCSVAVSLWPASVDSPHAPGSWLPLISTAAVAGLGFFVMAVVRRLEWLGLFAWSRARPAKPEALQRSSGSTPQTPAENEAVEITLLNEDRETRRPEETE
jgi:hypothetical protein